MVLVAINPNAPPFRSRCERSTEEVRDEVSVAMCAFVERLKPEEVVGPEGVRNRVLARHHHVAEGEVKDRTPRSE